MDQRKKTLLFGIIVIALAAVVVISLMKTPKQQLVEDPDGEWSDGSTYFLLSEECDTAGTELSLQDVTVKDGAATFTVKQVIRTDDAQEVRTVSREGDPSHVQIEKLVDGQWVDCRVTSPSGDVTTAQGSERVFDVSGREFDLAENATYRLHYRVWLLHGEAECDFAESSATNYTIVFKFAGVK